MTARALLERLASAVPGYSGYADLSDRRETDQALRRDVSERLKEHRLAVQRLVAEAVRTQRLDALEPLESLARRLERLADRIRHAPAGYSGLFDAQEVGAGVLDALTERDASLRDDVDGLAAPFEALSSPGPESLRAADRAMSALESAARSRDELLRGGA